MKQFYKNIFRPVTRHVKHDSENIPRHDSFGASNNSAGSLQEESALVGAGTRGEGICAQ